MKIEFNQNEIISGLRMYIESQGISLAGKDVSVDFTAGRGATGLSAEVNIEAQNFKTTGLVAGYAIKAVASTAPGTTSTEGITANTAQASSAQPEPETQTLAADGVATEAETFVADPVEGADTTSVDPSTLGNKASLFS